MDAVLQELHLPLMAYERVIKISFSSADAKVVELAAALGAGDKTTAKKIAHEIKGMFGNLRVEPLFQLAKELEAALMPESPADSAGKVSEMFSAKLQGIKDIFENEGS